MQVTASIVSPSSMICKIVKTVSVAEKNERICMIPTKQELARNGCMKRHDVSVDINQPSRLVQIL